MFNSNRFPNPMTQPRKDRLLQFWPLFAILAVGCTLRAILLAQFSRLPLFRHQLLDSLVYHQQALEIAGGKLVGDQAFFFGPLYPYLLGLFYAAFGSGALVPRMLNIVLELVTITLVFFLARRCFGRTVALIASVAYALYLPAIFYTSLPLMAPLVTALFTLLALLLAVAATDKPAGARWWFLAGLVLGLGCLARANLLALAPLFLLVLHRSHREQFWKPAGLFLLGIFLLIVPATLHNAVAEGELVPLTANAGLNFYVGNNPQASGRYMLPPGLDAQNDPRGRRFPLGQGMVFGHRFLGRTGAGRQTPQLFQEHQQHQGRRQCAAQHEVNPFSADSLPLGRPSRHLQYA